MLAYTYMERGKFALRNKPVPVVQDPHDAVVRVTLASICTSDLHIKHGSVPRAVPGVTVGHEMVGVVEQVGAAVTAVRPGDRVTVNVETFCGRCFFCEHGYVNNCIDPNGGWALGCRIDGGQAEYVRVPYADQGLNVIPDGVSDREALFVGDVLATGFWAARIAEIKPEDTVLILGAGPTGICTLLCARLRGPGQGDRLRAGSGAPPFCGGAVSGGADRNAGAGARFCPAIQPAWRRGRGARGGGNRRQLPACLGMRAPQRGGDRGCAVRRAADAAIARYVRQKPDLQDRRRGWPRLRGNPAPDRGGPTGHNAPDYAYFPVVRDRRGL